MDALQVTGADLAIYRAERHPPMDKLPTRHHPVLPLPGRGKNGIRTASLQ
jgi:hypothetical protein